MSTDASWIESMPGHYDSALGPALFAPFAAHLAELIAPLAPQRVLELAAGTGIATASLVHALPGATITATDLNAAMVAWAAARVPGPAWQQADAQRLEFADSTFDAVVSQFGVMFFPDKPAAFAEAARVMAPGGRLVFSAWDVVEASPFTAAMVDSLAAVLPADPPSFIVRVPHGYTEPDQIRADLRAGGLEPGTLERVVLRGSSPSARTLAEGFSLGTPLRFALADRGPLDELTAALADQMEGRLGTGRLEAELAAYIVTASRAG